jgi:hypothetical protein
LILGPIAMLAIVVLGLLALNVFPAFTPNLGREINVRIHFLHIDVQKNVQKNGSNVVGLNFTDPLHFYLS